MDDPFSRMQDPVRRADRHRKMSAEYSELAKDTASPFLRAYFQRTADEYRRHAEGEEKVLEHEHEPAAERTE